MYILSNIARTRHLGRLIVSSCGSLGENISLFVDYLLQLLTRGIPSFIQITHLTFQKPWELPVYPSGSLLVTVDVSSLYTNIPHDKGIIACRELFDIRADQSPPSEDLMSLIELILEANAFTVNRAYCLQLQAIPMKIRMAPLYANLLKGKFKQQFLQTQNRLPLV